MSDSLARMYYLAAMYNAKKMNYVLAIKACDRGLKVVVDDDIRNKELLLNSGVQLIEKLESSKQINDALSFEPCDTLKEILLSKQSETQEKERLSLLDAQSKQTLRTPSGNPYTPKMVQDNITIYTALKKKGARRSIIGTTLTITSIALMSSASWKTTHTPTSVQSTTSDPKGVIGMGVLLPSVPIAIVGLVQLGKGSSKLTELENHLKVNQVGLTLKENEIGFAFVHSF